MSVSRLRLVITCVRASAHPAPASLHVKFHAIEFRHVEVDELASDKRVAEAYSLWQDMRDEVFSFYSKSTPERVPLSQQKEFKPVRNMVIREVVQLSLIHI